jgi:hypothetical protein
MLDHLRSAEAIVAERRLRWRRFLIPSRPLLFRSSGMRVKGGNRVANRSRLTWSVTDETVRPFDEVLHVWCVRVSAVVLAPGKLATQ